MKRAWLLVGANVLVALLVILFLFAILTVLAAMASVVTTWPLFVLLACGVVISIVAIQALKTVDRSKTRLLGNLLNSSALSLYLLVIVAIGWEFFSATRERFVIPEGYEGEVYLVHGVPGGKPEERSFYRTETYRIPGDGVLLSQVPMNISGTRSEYYYESKDGKLTKIRNAWYSTIQDTPENLTNNRDVGMYFPRTAYGGDNNGGCKGPSDLFEIGTPSFLLSKRPQIDISAYLTNHAAACAKH
jgi:hypothetical protein